MFLRNALVLTCVTLEGQECVCAAHLLDLRVDALPRRHLLHERRHLGLHQHAALRRSVGRRRRLLPCTNPLCRLLRAFFLLITSTSWSHSERIHLPLNPPPLVHAVGRLPPCHACPATGPKYVSPGFMGGSHEPRAHTAQALGLPPVAHV